MFIVYVYDRFNDLDLQIKLIQQIDEVSYDEKQYVYYFKTAKNYF